MNWSATTRNALGEHWPQACEQVDMQITIRTLTAWQGQLTDPPAGELADSEEAAEYQEIL